MDNQVQADSAARWKERVGLVLRIVISGGLLIWVILRTDPREIIGNVAQANLVLILVGFVLFR